MRGAILSALSLQRVDPGRPHFSDAELFKEAEDPYSQELFRICLGTYDAATTAGLQAEEALLARTVRSGESLASAGADLATSTPEPKEKVIRYGGSLIEPLARLLASLVVRTRRAASDQEFLSLPIVAFEWVQIDEKLKVLQKENGWSLVRAADLLRSGERCRTPSRTGRTREVLS